MKIISFDLDGTLVTREFDNKVWWEALPKLYAKKHNISFERAKELVVKDYGKITPREPVWYDIKHWLNHFELEKSWKEVFSEYKEEINLYPEAEETLKELKKKYKLILITNATREFIEFKLKHTKLGNYFSHIFSATSDFARGKHGANIFKRICKILKIEPKELIHVGDDEEFDYKVPKSIGIKAIFIDRKKERKGRDIIHNLKEILPLMDSMSY